jgi:hypothetical protein
MSMPFTPDPAKSEKARQDVRASTIPSIVLIPQGNASFKRGRWTEAIGMGDHRDAMRIRKRAFGLIIAGHYTTAVVSNPTDPIPYTNRAAAYLKLEKWVV